MNHKVLTSRFYLDPICSLPSADIGFILDSSYSLRKRYKDEKYFLKKLTTLFANRNNDIKSSVITFSSWSELSIKFSDHKTTAAFNAAVDAIPLMGFKTRIDKALQQANYEMFTRRNGLRNGNPKILILLTDGTQTGRGSIDPAIPAEELRKAGVYLIVIGIGTQIDQNECKKISGYSGKFFKVASFDELISNEFINKVSSSVCPGKK